MQNILTAFLKSESTGGLLLMAAAVLAVILANSPCAGAYTALLNTPLLHHSLTHWVNDALMALFFLLVGLEIKRELIQGELSTWPQRLLPGLCALGGMVVPALLYAAVNHNSPQTLNGWAIPTATDIAFALGILALFPRAPTSLKIFLTALAILDDLGAILLIAVFYSHGFSPVHLALAAILTASLITFNRSRVTALWPYLITGLLLWLCIDQSGLHATLAGVILALTIPLKTQPGPLLKLEHALHPYVAFLVIPIFGFFNAGLPLTGITLNDFSHPLTLGILVGLLIGKQLGVGLCMWFGIRFLKVPMPLNTSPLQLYAVTLLCAIGFTMSLFIGGLAVTANYLPEVRLGILTASIIAAIGAAFILALTSPRK